MATTFLDEQPGGTSHNTQCFLLGDWASSTVFFSGHALLQARGTNDEINIAFTNGTSVSTTIMLSGYFTGNVLVSLDGAAFSSVTPSVTAAVPATALVATVADTSPHTLCVKLSSSSYIDRWPNGVTGLDTFTFVGATPTFSVPVFGQIQSVSGLVAGNHAIVDGTASAAAYGSITSYGVNANSANWTDQTVRFKATTTNLWVWGYNLGNSVSISIDGASDSTPVFMDSSGIFKFFQIATGLDGSTEHEYTINTSGQQWEPVYIMADAINTTTTYTARIQDAYYGDSITIGNFPAGSSSCKSWAHMLGTLLNHGTVNRGISGSAVHGSGDTRYAQITGLSPQPATVFIMYGVNDISAAGGATTPTSTFGTAYQLMLNNLLSGTAYKIVCIGMVPNTSYSSGTMANWNGSGNGVQGSIAAVIAGTPAYASRLSYIDPTGWGIVPTTGVDTYDGTHPNPAGNLKITNGVFAALNAVFAHFTTQLFSMQPLSGGQQ